MIALLALAAALLAPAGEAHVGLERVGPQPLQPAGAVTTGTLPAGQPLHVTVTLRPRNPAAMSAYARAVSDPASPDYRHFLRPAQFGRRFGATPAQIATVESALRSRGLTPGPASAGGLSIPVTASAGTLERAFAVSLSQLRLAGRRTAIASDERPALAAQAAPVVQAVVGLNTAWSPRPLLERRSATGAPAAAGATAIGGLTQAGGGVASGAGGVASPHASGRTPVSGPHACAGARNAQSTSSGQGAYTADQIASAYNFAPLYTAGDGGSGVTVAVYELEPNDPNDIAAYQSCYGTHASISYVRVAGGSGSGPGTGEAALDIENLIGLAPNANVLVYQGPNSNSGAPGSGPYETFSAIVNQDRASVVSVSWGQCEPDVGQSAAEAESTLFTQAAIEGQSIVAAAGDSGAQDCDTGSVPPQVQPAVDDPAAQPYVTGVGGTTLSNLGPRPAENVWNSGGLPVSSGIQAGASGGGLSSFWAMPPAQLDAAPALGVRAAAAGNSPCGAGLCRAVPDVSADADPSTGYLFYWNGSGSVAGQPAGWQGIGGTSAAAPVWSAVLALADGNAACSRAPVGYANPALYRAAGADYGAVFNDVTTGNNDFTGTNGGRYAARSGYDAATGLGTPNAVSLVPALCAQSVRLAPLNTQRSAEHAQVSLRLRAARPAGDALTYSASGLPRGLKLNPGTGRISGRPTRTGRFTVLLRARDAQGASSAENVLWTVGAAPRLSQVSLTPASGGALLSFVVSAGRGSPALQAITVTLPRGLRLSRSTGGVAVHGTAAHSRPLGSTARITSPATVTITLRRALSSLRVRLSPPSLRPISGPLAHAQSRSAMSLSVTDATAGRSRLTARLVAR